MTVERAGDRWPLHPDSYGHPLGRTLGADVEADLFGEGTLDLSDAEVEALWAQEQEFRAAAATTPIGKPHAHAGCGHHCISWDCTLYALLNHQACEACRVHDEATGKYWAR